jgi:SAM-dependent methyltransferase
MSDEQIPTEHDPVVWFAEHYDGAAQEVIDFIEADGIQLKGKVVADVGSGDGLIDLGFVAKARPAKLIGFDPRPTDVDALRRSASAAGIEEPFPDAETLAFVQSRPDFLPAPGETFDVVFTWSVFEHVSEPVLMFQEIHRILKPDGVLFLQLWPFYSSQHGGHAWMTIPEPFAHLRRSPFDMEQTLRGRQGTDATRTADDEFRSLNRITLDSLQRALLLAHLRVAKVAVIGDVLHVPLEVAHEPLSDLAIAGVKLLAVPF